MRPSGGAAGNKARLTAGCAETETCNLGECRAELAGEVPSVEQFTAQHSRAEADSAVWAFMRAALQQSISPIAPPMLHDCSPECRGVPAKAPPATINKSTSDVNRVLMAIAHCRETTNACQDPAGPVRSSHEIAPLKNFLVSLYCARGTNRKAQALQKLAPS